ncbi:MAG: caspase family protein [Azospirillaceae bacterium]
MRRGIRAVAVLGVLAAVCSTSLPARAGISVADRDAAPERVALVIGNAAYAHARPLDEPVRSADAMADRLGAVGFDVTRAGDLDRAGFLDTLQAFAGAAEDAAVAVVYYAGYGLQLDGRTYLMPVDARFETALDLERQVRLASVVDAAEAARAAVVLVDACRDNPFVERLPSGTRSAAGLAPSGAAPAPAIEVGLREVRRLRNTLVGFATAPGSRCPDGSAYAEALVEHLRPGVELSLLMRRVRETVIQRTGHAQWPVVRETLRGDPVYLVPAGFPAPPPTLARSGWRERLGNERAQVLFSTRVGEPGFDTLGPGRPSPFSAALAAALRDTPEAFGAAFDRASATVAAETDGDQHPVRVAPQPEAGAAAGSGEPRDGGGAGTGRRVAWILANSAYEAAFGLALQGPPQDAAVMADVLAAQGYAVEVAGDLDPSGVAGLLGDIRARSRALGPGARLAFFYSGLGAHCDGTDYLVPVGVAAARLPEPDGVAVPAVIDALEAGGAERILAVFDSPRDRSLCPDPGRR